MATTGNVCRACLKEPDKHYPLFEVHTNNRVLASILNRFTDNKVSQNDNLSNILCEPCTRTLLQFNDFLLTYETSTKTLYNKLNSQCDTKVILSESNKIESVATETSKKFNFQSSTENASFTQLEITRERERNRNFICDVCGKICHKKSDLKDHLETHDSELKYSCSICKKRLKCRTSLVGHMRMHYRPNQYMCEFCGNKFTQMSTLRTHKIQLHILEKKFECVICERKFSLKSSLKKHVERHKNREGGVEKIFKCSQCDMGYLDKSSLSRHVDVKHLKGNKNLCEICDVSFSTVRNLLRHKNVIHINKQI